jgi:hypothetical protein
MLIRRNARRQRCQPLLDFGERHGPIVPGIHPDIAGLAVSLQRAMRVAEQVKRAVM